MFAAAPMIGRRATADCEIAGTAISEGDFLWYNIGGANRDPAVFDEAGTVDIGRTRTST